MNREVHVRIWESPEVKFLRATRPTATSERIFCRYAKRHGKMNGVVGCILRTMGDECDGATSFHS